MDIQVNTTQYQFSHGKAPRGRGTWCFELDAPGHGNRSELYMVSCELYSNALREAKAYAKEQGWTRVTVGA